MSVAATHVHAWRAGEWQGEHGATTGMVCDECGERDAHYAKPAARAFTRYESPNQARVLNDWTSPLLFYSSGYRGGKTWTQIQFVLDRLMLGPPGAQGFITEPTYKMVTRILERGPSSVEKWVRLRGIPWDYNRTDHYVKLPGDRGIWLLSAEDPDSLPGFTALVGAMDEADLTDERAFEQLSMRLSDPRGTCQMLCGSTFDPYNTNSWFDRMINARRDDGSRKHTVVSGTTMDNFTVAESFLQRQLSMWERGSAEHDVYVLGIKRVLQGSIYTALKPAVHLVRCGNPTAGQLVVGGDFNEQFMVSPIGRYLNGELHIFDEVITRGSRRQDATPGAGDDAATRFHYARVRKHLGDKGLAMHREGGVRQPNREQVQVYCDATGSAKKTSAQTTDHALVRECGFWTVHDPSNPSVRDSITNVQAALHERRLFIDPDGAPLTARAMLEHTHDKRTGAPRKDYDQVRDIPFDAFTDCVRYLAWHLLPLHRRR